MLSAMQGPRPPPSLEGRVGAIEQPPRARGFSSRPPSDWSCSPGPARQPPTRRPSAASEILCSWSLRRSSPPSHVLCCRCGCSAEPWRTRRANGRSTQESGRLVFGCTRSFPITQPQFTHGGGPAGRHPEQLLSPWSDLDRHAPASSRPGWCPCAVCLARGTGDGVAGGGGPRGGRRQVTQRHTQRAQPHPCPGLCPQTAPRVLGTMSDLCSPGWKQKNVNQDLFKL